MLVLKNTTGDTGHGLRIAVCFTQEAYGLLENPHDCCAPHLVIYFGSIWTAANKRLRSHTVKAIGSPSIKAHSLSLGGPAENQSAGQYLDTGCLLNLWNSKLFWLLKRSISSQPQDVQQLQRSRVIKQTIFLNAAVISFQIKKKQNIYTHASGQSEQWQLHLSITHVNPQTWQLFGIGYFHFKHDASNCLIFHGLAMVQMAQWCLIVLHSWRACIVLVLPIT